MGANLHGFLAGAEMDEYSPLVDFMANEYLGGRTMLYMLDAIICAPSEGTSNLYHPERISGQPFQAAGLLHEVIAYEEAECYKIIKLRAGNQHGSDGSSYGSMGK